MRTHRGFLLLAVALIVAIAPACRREPPGQTASRAQAASTAATQTDPAVDLPQPAALARPAAEPMPEPVAVPRKQIADAMRQAAQELASGHLDERDVPPAEPAASAPVDTGADTVRSDTTPASTTPAATKRADALALYRGVLTTDPANTAARDGILAVDAALLARAHAALARGDVVSAQRDADRLALLHADADALAALQHPLDRGWKIAGLVERAQRLERLGGMVHPEPAIAAFRQVLRADPGNRAADAGLARIEGGFIARAMAEAGAGHYPQSDRWIALAARVRPDSQALQEASARIVAIRQRAAAELKAQADNALASGDPDRAERLLPQIERAAPLSAEVRELRVHIALVRNYGMFKPGQAFTEQLASAGRTPEMVVLPVGRFRMGSGDDEPGHDASESPQRVVRFAHGFAMARTETTVEQFGRFVQATHYVTDAERAGHSMVYDEVKGKLVARDGVDWRKDHSGEPAPPQQPVLHVSWNDAQAYTIWLSKETSHLYRLPSEAEFEYALRAGTATAYPWPGASPPKGIGNLAGIDPSPSGRRWGDAFERYADGYWGPAPVGRFAANAFGLQDIVGNVAEWTQDCWHDGYRRAPDDGVAWVNPGCAQRVARGASWASSPVQARSSYRAPLDTAATSPRLGFRIVREL